MSKPHISRDGPPANHPPPLPVNPPGLPSIPRVLSRGQNIRRPLSPLPPAEWCRPVPIAPAAVIAGLDRDRKTRKYWEKQRDMKEGRVKGGDWSEMRRQRSRERRADTFPAAPTPGVESLAFFFSYSYIALLCPHFLVSPPSLVLVALDVLRSFVVFVFATFFLFPYFESGPSFAECCLFCK